MHVDVYMKQDGGGPKPVRTLHRGVGMSEETVQLLFDAILDLENGKILNLVQAAAELQRATQKSVCGRPTTK